MDARAQYEARVRRVTDATCLREPDRVPVIPVMEAFPVYYGGGTIQGILYDYKKAESWFDKFFRDFQPDLGWDPIMFFPAQCLEVLGLNWFRWPGNQLDDPNGMYQFLEGEYMKGGRVPGGFLQPDPLHAHQMDPALVPAPAGIPEAILPQRHVDGLHRRFRRLQRPGGDRFPGALR